MEKFKHFIFWFFTLGFIAALVIGVYGLIEDYPILEAYTELIAYFFIIGGFAIYISVLKFALKFPWLKVLNTFAYALGIPVSVAFLLGYFLFSEIYAWIVFSLTICLIFLAIGVGLLLGAYYLANKLLTYRGSLFLLLMFGSELVFIGVISITAWRFII